MEVSVVVSEAEALLENKICHENYSEFRSAYGDLGDLLHTDGHVSWFNMSI